MGDENQEEVNNVDDVDGCRLRVPKRQCVPVKSASEMVQRFSQQRSWSASTSNKKINPDTFTRQAADHGTKYNMDKLEPVGQTFDGYGASRGQTNVTFKTVGLFEIGEYSFFVDPDDPFRGGFSTTDKNGKRIATERGYAEIKFSHITSNRDVPSRKLQATRTKLVDRVAPQSLRVPQNDLPDLYKLDSETYAEALLRAFEDKFIDGQGNQIYSPCNLWNDESRKLMKGDKSKFTTWCTAHYAARVLYKEKEPKNVDDNLTQLIKKGRKYKPQPLPKGGWYELIKDIN